MEAYCTREQIKLLCHRRFGIGADGIILVEDSSHQDAWWRSYY